MPSPLISVIIPVYNAARYIEATIASVINQDEKDLEIIIVNDGSTDATMEIISGLAETDHRMVVLSQQNKGVSAARNLGYKQSKGKYIAFLDADDIWLPNNLSLKIAKLKDSSFGMVHSDAQVIDEASHPQGNFLRGQEGNLLNAMLEWNGTQVPGPSSILIRREVIESAGLFDERLSTSADQDFFIRVAALYQIGRVNEITWMYRVHPENMHKNIARMEHDVLLVFQKASESGMFYSKIFARKCFAKTYYVLAMSWAGDGKNTLRALRYIFKAVIAYPPTAVKFWNKIVTKIKP
jgi:glycosyltransferase involved in cell wall biosynthesis